MSVFRVNLRQGNQSRSCGTSSRGTESSNGYVCDPAIDSNDYTIQRKIFAPGPNLISRQLNDGETFTDCNYWKRFVATPNGTSDPDLAFLELVSDDGSVFDDHNPNDSTFPVVESNVVANGSGFGAANLIDIVDTYGAHAVFVQISTDADITVRLNGSSSADFTLDAAATQVFNAGDLTVTSLDFANSSGGPAAVQVIMSLRVVCNS